MWSGLTTKHDRKPMQGPCSSPILWKVVKQKVPKRVFFFFYHPTIWQPPSPSQVNSWLFLFLCVVVLSPANSVIIFFRKSEQKFKISPFFRHWISGKDAWYFLVEPEYQIIFGLICYLLRANTFVLFPCTFHVLPSLCSSIIFSLRDIHGVMNVFIQ